MSWSSSAEAVSLPAAPALRARPRLRDDVALALLAALVYLLARPPLYERDGYIYQLLGRDFRGGTNPHHLLWNGVQYLIGRLDALVGIHSVVPFQLAGIACVVASAVGLHGMLLRRTGQRPFAFVAALFVALAPWTWFMAYQNQPYAPMFLLFVLFLRAFDTPDGAPPEGWRFAAAAASAVGMIVLQQAAVLIVVGAGVCFLVLGSWRRLAAWALATGVPTAALYVGVGALLGVRDVGGFSRWVTTYLRSQHALQVRFPDFLSKSVMGIVSTFVNQDPFKDAVVDAWSNATILLFYGAVGAALLALAIVLVVRRRRARMESEPASRALVWVSVASIISWGIFCFLWEPTNYYWFILLAPFFVYAAAELRPSPKAGRRIAAALLVATVWNLYTDHDADAEGSRRAPEPQLRVIAAHMRPVDRLWVVDLGWSAGIDYDLLASASAFDHGPRIEAVSDVVGQSADVAAWERTIADSTRLTFQRGGRAFISARAFDDDTYAQRWEQSSFADYEVPRQHPVDWAALGRDLPAFIDREYDVAPAGFAIADDSILELRPRR